MFSAKPTTTNGSVNNPICRRFQPALSDPWLHSSVMRMGRVEGHPACLDPTDDPYLAQALLDGVDVAVEAVVTGVLAGQRIEVVEGAVGDELCVAADLDEAGVLLGSTMSKLTFRLASRLRPFCRSSVVLTRAHSPS